MLAPYYRLRLLWDGDQTLTYDNGARVAVDITKWKISAGVLVYSATLTDDFGFGAGDTIADDGEEEITVINNTADLYWGVKGTLYATADQNSTDGTLYLFLEESQDNTEWPSDKADFDIDADLRLVAALSFSTDAEDETRAVNFEF